MNTSDIRFPPRTPAKVLARKENAGKDDAETKRIMMIYDGSRTAIMLDDSISIVWHSILPSSHCQGSVKYAHFGAVPDPSDEVAPIVLVLWIRNTGMPERLLPFGMLLRPHLGIGAPVTPSSSSRSPTCRCCPFAICWRRASGQSRFFHLVRS